MLQTKRFQVINEGFLCASCGRDVLPTSGGTPRNHCPFCLCSKHVDVNPGDRANSCHGLMTPISVTTDGKKTYVIHHRCARCGQRTQTKAIVKDDRQRDDVACIVALSREPLLG